MRKHSRPRWDRPVLLKIGTLVTVEDAHNSAEDVRHVVATAFDNDQSSERETDFHLGEQDGLRHCIQQAITFRRDLERDEERVEQDDELERAPTIRRNVGAHDTNA